jgi:hypothetical protein
MMISMSKKKMYTVLLARKLLQYNRKKWGGLLARGFGQRASRRKANVLISKRARNSFKEENCLGQASSTNQ